MPRPPGHRGRLARGHRPVVRPAAPGRRDRAVWGARSHGPRPGRRPLHSRDRRAGPGNGRVHGGPTMIGAAVLGSGNIGTDLMIKLLRATGPLRMTAMAGIDPASDGLARAARLGVATTA